MSQQVQWYVLIFALCQKKSLKCIVGIQCLWLMIPKKNKITAPTFVKYTKKSFLLRQKPLFESWNSSHICTCAYYQQTENDDPLKRICCKIKIYNSKVFRVKQCKGHDKLYCIIYNLKSDPLKNTSWEKRWKKKL